MTDRLTLTRAFEGAGLQSEAAERIATEIVRVIDQSAAAKPSPSHQGQIAKAFEIAGIERPASEQIAMVNIDLIRQRHPAA